MSPEKPDLEKTRLELGFIALTDCAPLAVAQVLGLFEAEGLDVRLTRQASWANVRDRLAAGLIDGAHMLGPMAVAQSLGVGSEPTPLAVPLALNLNGSAITLSKALADELRAVDPAGMARRPRSAAGVAKLADARRAAGAPPLTFAVVFPYSIHNYELRSWLASGGVRVDRDVRLIVVPPPRMVEKLEAGEIDGFCVGAPWNGQAVSRGLGEVALNAAEWWGATPDKVLGFTRDWAERHPATLQAVCRAVLKAAAWADAPENRPTVATILSRPEFVGAAEAMLRLSLEGAPPLAPGEAPAQDPDYIVFNRYAASFPWKSHAQWFAAQMMRWGQAPRGLDMAVAASVYRPDLFRPAAEAVGQAAPLADTKREGAHAAAWTLTDATAPIAMRGDRFLDGAIFESEPERIPSPLAGEGVSEADG